MVSLDFNYYIADRKTQVSPDSELWHALLPSDMKAENIESTATTGDYFEAATVFLKENDYAAVMLAIEDQCNRTARTSEVNCIDIIMVKHGQFYHPARVDILLDETTVACALNLAASTAGADCMELEYPALQKVNKLVDAVPKVYRKGTVEARGGYRVSMFLANWFEHFNEFHVSYDDGVKKVIVWDYENGFYYLNDADVFDLYRKAAFIMTKCYNPQTYELIQPWHHAAGDFVVKNDGAEIDVRLITVRQYTPMFENCPEDTESMLEAALIFLIGLSIRMRLDRVDGVDEAVWGDEIVLKGVVQGFFEAIQRVTVAGFDNDFSGAFKGFLTGVSPEILIEYTTMVAGSYHPESSDYALVVENIQAHLSLLSKEIKKAVPAFCFCQ